MMVDMAGDNKIPAPISFNASKHHLGRILQILKNSNKTRVKELDSICHNYIDIYTGKLSPLEISEAIIQTIHKCIQPGKNNFERWLSINNHHRKIVLSDKSEWIIRPGNDPARYVHIHPAKTGPLTLRFKGSTLKTVYRLKTRTNMAKSNISLKEINQARVDAGLSPVKKPETGKGIMKCWEYFHPDKNSVSG